MLQTKIDLHFPQLGLPALIFDHHHSGLFLMQKFNRANFPPSPTSSYLYHKAFNTNISSHFLVIINSLKYCTSSSWRDRSGRSWLFLTYSKQQQTRKLKQIFTKYFGFPNPYIEFSQLSTINHKFSSESERFERRAVIQDGPPVSIPSYGRTAGLPCGGGLHGPYGVPCDSRAGVSPRTPRSPRAERRRSRNSRPQTPSRPETETGKEADYSSVPMAGL